MNLDLEMERMCIVLGRTLLALTGDSVGCYVSCLWHEVQALSERLVQWYVVQAQS